MEKEEKSMKFNKSIALGASVCALALTAAATPVHAADTTSTQTQTTQTTQNNQTSVFQSNAQSVKINYNANFGIAVWSTPNAHTTGKFVPGQTEVKISGSQVVNGKTWYLLADNSGWIDGAYVTTTTSSTTTNNSSSTTNTNKNTSSTDKNTTTSNVVAVNEVVTAGNNGATVYSAPKTSAKTSRVLSKGSRWRAFSRTTADNNTWYNLGGNQYVLASDLVTASNKPSSSSNKTDSDKNTTNTSLTTSTVATTPANGTVKITNTKGATLYSAPSKAAKTSRVLSNGSAWRTFKAANNDGAAWLNLGGNQWVLTADTNAAKSNSSTTNTNKNQNQSSSTDVKSTPVNGTLQINYVPGYSIAVWGKPGQDRIAGKYLKHGTSWKFYAIATANGHTWYNLGGNQWIDGNYAKLKTAPKTSGTIDLNFSYATVNYKGNWSIAIWTEPNGHTTGKYYKNNTFLNVLEVSKDGKWSRVSDPITGQAGWVQTQYLKPVFFDDQR